MISPGQKYSFSLPPRLNGCMLFSTKLSPPALGTLFVAAFKVLARNWGLFGGALDSSSVQNVVGVSTESSSPPGAALHTDFTTWEENHRTNSPIGRPCRNDTKLPIKTSPFQAEVNQPTRHVLRAQAAMSDVSVETSTARNDSPELVMLWETNEPSSEVDASCAGIAHPNQAMATDYSDRYAA